MEERAVPVTFYRASLRLWGWPASPAAPFVVRYVWTPVRCPTHSHSRTKHISGLGIGSVVRALAGMWKQLAGGQAEVPLRWRKALPRKEDRNVMSSRQGEPLQQGYSTAVVLWRSVWFLFWMVKMRRQDQGVPRATQGTTHSEVPGSTREPTASWHSGAGEQVLRLRSIKNCLLTQDTGNGLQLYKSPKPEPPSKFRVQ